MGAPALSEGEGRRRIVIARRENLLSARLAKRAEVFLIFHMEGLVPPENLTAIEGVISRKHRHEETGGLRRVIEITRNDAFVSVTVEITPTNTDDRSQAKISGRLMNRKWSGFEVDFTQTRHNPGSGITGRRALFQAEAHFGTMTSPPKKLNGR